MELLDKKLAIEQAGNNPILAKELFTMLLNELPSLRDKLNTAVDHDSSTEMWEHAHKIYGSTAYCGVPALKQAAKAFEDCLREEEYEQIPFLLNNLNQEVERLLSEGAFLLDEDWS